MPKIKVGRDKIVYRGKYIRTIEREFVGVQGRRDIWEMVKRRINKPPIIVVPITPDQKLVLIKIFRIPQKKYLIEFCAGSQDKKGESLAKLARRELLEETGYTAPKFEKIISGLYEIGTQPGGLAIYLAQGARKITQPHCENGEEIEVVTVPLAQIRNFLAHPPTGVTIDLKIYIGLYFLLERGFKF